MKTIALFTPLLMVGCITYTPKQMYVHPENYRCDIMIATTWDRSYPVNTFHQKMELGKEYKDVHGMSYKLVATEDSSVFSLQVSVPKP